MSQIRSSMKGLHVAAFSYCDIDEIYAEAAEAGIQHVVWYSNRNIPPLEENIEGFRRRVLSFQSILTDYADIVEDQCHIMAVTHADFLNVRLQLLDPNSLYAPLECGFFVETFLTGDADTELGSAVSSMHRVEKIM